MKLRVGLIGLGDAWEERHRPALRAMTDRFEVRAVFEEVRHRAELAAAEFGGSAVDGFRALVRREDIDAVMLLSAGWYGVLPLLAACDSGKAVYFGAGLGMAPDEIQRIRNRVEEAGIAFVAEFPRRQSPATLRLKELIATTLGLPQLVFCHQRLPVVSRGNRPPARRQRRSATQELVEMVDWCRYVVGREPKWVTSAMHRPGAEAAEVDYQTISLDFSESHRVGSGPVAQISCGRYIPEPWHEAGTYRPPAAMQISCENGIAFIDLPSTLIWFDEAGRHQESLQSERPVGEQLLDSFFRAVTSLVTKTGDLDDACRALSIVEEAARSHREGRRIAI